LNNLQVYSLFDSEYQSYFGFTESEVSELIQKVGIVDQRDAVKNFYNGYIMGGVLVYNPWSLMNYLSKKRLESYWGFTSNDELLKTLLLKGSSDVKKLFTDLIQGKVIDVLVEINLRYEDFMEDPDMLWTLLLFCGYLTLENTVLPELSATSVYQLRIPNGEINKVYNKIFQKWLSDKIGRSNYSSFLRNLAEGQVEKFTKELTHYLFSCTSSHDFQSEAEYHTFVLGLLASIRDTHVLCSNKEYGSGRPDCLLIPKHAHPQVKRKLGVILEFKHVHFKKSPKDLGELTRVCHQYAQEALVQINMRGYRYAFAQYDHVDEILKIGIAFSHRMVSSAYTISQIVNAEEVTQVSVGMPIQYVDSLAEE
jgi:hypothetical protein